MKKIAILLAVLLTAAAFCISAYAEQTSVYLFEEDFSSLEDKASFVDYEPLTKEWSAVRATQNDGFDGQGDNGSLHFGPFTQLVSNRELKGPYVFSTDIKVPNNQFFGIFVRSTGEALSGAEYYEADGNKSDDGVENEWIGSTGIYVIPRATKLMLIIKTADPSQSKGIGDKKAVFDVDCDFSSGFVPLVFEDDGEVVTVRADGKTVCTVRMTDEQDGDYMSTKRLFTTAVVKDKDGDEVMTVSDCRICAEYSTVAYGMRINSANIDNIRLEEFEKAAEQTESLIKIRRIDMKTDPEKNEYLKGETLDLTDTYIEVTYENGIKEDVRVTSDMVSGFDSSSLGARVVTVSYGGTSTYFSVYIVEEYGKNTGAAEITVDIDTKISEMPEGEKPGGAPVAVIAAACAAVVVICAGIAAVMVIRRKKA